MYTDVTVAHLAKLIAEESAALVESLGRVGDDLWHAPPATGNGAGSRPTGGIPRPTEDITMHPRREALSDQVRASHRILRDTAVALRGVRLGVDLTHAQWQGEQ